MRLDTRTQRRGFSLVELVIVIVIIGVISAIAIPRLTRGAHNAGSSALKGDLAVLRNAIELYRAEHEGRFPTEANFVDQMTKYSDITGTSFSTTPDVGNGIVYGPYLKDIPPLPVGENKGDTGVAAADAAGVGWIYTAASGTIKPNTAVGEADQDGVDYNTY